ncbi:MAG: hypothetical protein U1E39_18760 [Planctomycetota bacterium]
MSRSNPDLFEFFGKGRGRPATSARAVSTPVRGDAATVTVSRRLMVLLGAGAVLLSALSFLGGLAIGRGKRLGADGAELVRRDATARPAPDTWILRGQALPKIATAGTDNLEQRALAAFRERYPMLAPFLASAPVEEARGRLMNGHFRLIVRGFESEASALQWAKALSAERVAEYAPFRDSRPEKAPR